MTTPQIPDQRLPGETTASDGIPVAVPEAVSGALGVLLVGWRGVLAPADTSCAHSTTLPTELEPALGRWMGPARRTLSAVLPKEMLGCGGREIPLDGVREMLRMRLGEALTGVLLQASGDGEMDPAGLSPEALSAKALERRFPGLAALLAKIGRDWERGTEVFLRRLHADRGRLAEWIGAPELPPIAEIAGTGADLHEGGAAGLRIAFEGGQKIFYKPRPVTGELLWGELLEAVAGVDGACALPAARVLAGGPLEGAGGGYGWMAEVKHVPAGWMGGKEDAARYWRRAGELLCVAALVGLSDLHMGNVVATPEGPVVVDAECLGSSGLGSPGATEARGASVVEEVLAGLRETGLLPGLEGAKGSGGLPDISGLFGSAVPVRTVRVPCWERSGSGLLRCVFVPARLLGQANLCGDAASPMTVLPHLLAGYRGAAEALLKARAGLLAAGGWVDRLQRLHRPRVLVRSTLTYGLLLGRSLDPQWLAGPVRRGALLEALRAAPALLPRAIAEAPAVLEAEAAAVGALQVPRFEAAPGTRMLAAHCGRVVAPYASTEGPGEGMRRRLEGLSKYGIEGAHVAAVVLSFLKARRPGSASA